MKLLKIDVTKINKSLLFKGGKGTYLDAALHDNKDGVDEWGNSGFITQSVSKEARAAGERGPIIGNWKEVGVDKKPTPPTASPSAPLEDDDIQF